MNKTSKERIIMKNSMLFNPAEMDLTTRFREAVKMENEKQPLLGVPTFGFDEKRNEPYLQFSDGRRIYEAPKE